MGCDIHGALEIKGADGKWHFKQKVDLGRNYGAFAVLFGVRNYNNLPALAEDRGLPKDSDEQTLFRNIEKMSEDEVEKLYKEHPELAELPAESGDSHSQSYVLASEIPAWLDKETTFIYIYKKGWKEKAKKQYAEFKADVEKAYAEATAEKPEESLRKPDDIIGTEEEFVKRTEPLAIIAQPKAAINATRWGGVNVTVGFMFELMLAEHREDAFSDMTEILEAAKKHPEDYEIVEDKTTMRKIHGWLEDKEWKTFILRTLPTLAREHGGNNVRWVVWFDN